MHILTQREQWPYRCAADDDDDDSPVESPVSDSDNDSDQSGYDLSGLKNTPSINDLAAEIQFRNDKGTGTGGTGGTGTPSTPKTPGMPATPSAGGAAPASGDEAGWKARIQKDITPQLQSMGITDPGHISDAVNHIYNQGITESGWQDIPQAITDVNSEKGTPAQSYLQYVPSTFEHAMDLAGTPGADIHDPDAQIRGVIPLEKSEGKFGPSGFSDSSGSGVGYGHGWG